MCTPHKDTIITQQLQDSQANLASYPQQDGKWMSAMHHQLCDISVYGLINLITNMSTLPMLPWSMALCIFLPASAAVINRLSPLVFSGWSSMLLHPLPSSSHFKSTTSFLLTAWNNLLTGTNTQQFHRHYNNVPYACTTERRRNDEGRMVQHLHRFTSHPCYVMLKNAWEHINTDKCGCRINDLEY